jgi:RNA polymerase sigma factor (sigma-70 family)
VCENDRKLLDALAVDPARIADVIEEYGAYLLGRLYAYANDRGHGNADVEDVFQEALLKLFDPKERIAIVHAGGCILPYLTRWGYWRLDTLRRQRNDPLDEQLLEGRPTNGFGLDQTHDSEAEDAEAGGDITSDTLAALERAWLQLSPRDQLLLTLRYFEGYSEAEIAEYFKVAIGTAKKALSDARRRLRRLMEIEGFDVEE